MISALRDYAAQLREEAFSDFERNGYFGNFEMIRFEAAYRLDRIAALFDRVRRIAGIGS